MIAEIKAEIEKVEKKISRELSHEESLFSNGLITLQDLSFVNAIKELSSKNSLEKLSYEKFVDNCDTILESAEKLKDIKERLEYLQFLKSGNKYDFERLKILFKEKGLKEKFPNFNLERYKELVNNPVLELNSWEGKTVKYDPFLVSKILISMNQLIYDEMDVRIVNVGKEGSGKSCFASQIIFYYWWFMKEVGLIEYEFDVRKLFFSSVSKLLEEQEKQKENDYCRIFCLDEGYELNRSNYRDEDSRNYKDSMRSERKMLRIEMVNLPQLGELELAITQTRTNFIFEACLENDKKTSTLKKGKIKFFIIPRGEKIYSRYLRKELSAREIINILSAVLRDKNDSYKGLPDNILIHEFHFGNVWAFDKSIYDSFIKKENKIRRTKSQIKISDYIGYLLYSRLPATKHLGMFDMKNKADMTMYKHFQKFRESIKIRFETNANLLLKYKQMEEIKKNEI